VEVEELKIDIKYLIFFVLLLILVNFLLTFLSLLNVYAETKIRVASRSLHERQKIIEINLFFLSKNISMAIVGIWQLTFKKFL